MEIIHNQEIIAPIEIVFDYLNDDEKMKLWMEGLESTEYPSGKDAEHPVGTEFIQTIQESGHPQQYTGVVTAFKPPTLLGVKLKGNAFTANVTYELAAHARKTELEYHCELVFSSLLHRVVGFLFKGLNQRIVKTQIKKLQLLCEQAAVRRSTPPEK